MQRHAKARCFDKRQHNEVTACLHFVKFLMVHHVLNVIERRFLSGCSSNQVGSDPALVLLKHTNSVELEESETANPPQENNGANQTLSPRIEVWNSFCQALFGSAEFRYLIDIDYAH